MKTFNYFKMFNLKIDMHNKISKCQKKLIFYHKEKQISYA